MDKRYAKPFAMHPRMRAQMEAEEKAEGKKPEPEAKKPKKTALPPNSDMAARRAHLIETKPSKKEVLAYFASMVEEIAEREEA